MTDPLYSNPLPMRSPLEDMLNDKTYVVSVYILYLLGFFTGGVTAVIGLIMAYVLKGAAGPRAYSHYVFAIRTFWLTVVWALIGSVVLGVGCLLTAILILTAPLIFQTTPKVSANERCANISSVNLVVRGLSRASSIVGIS